MRLRVAAWLTPGAVAIVVLAAGCGGSVAPSAAGPTPTPATSAPVTSAPTPALIPSGAGATEAAPSVLQPGVPGPDVRMDPGLLGVLPASIAGAPVALEPDSFPEALQDASFVANVDAAAFAVVFDGGDLASGAIAHLRPGVFSDAFFRDWRDSYDDGACGQAGGVATHAEVPLGGRTVYITRCSGGLRTYHAWVPERGVVVSLFSLGDRRFGEQLVAGIRP